MEKHLDKLPSFVEAIKSIKETIIANIVFIGQIPAPTFKEKKRTDFFMERLAEFQVDECTTDGYRNPIGIIRGTAPSKPPVFASSKDKGALLNLSVSRRELLFISIFSLELGDKAKGQS